MCCVCVLCVCVVCVCCVWCVCVVCGVCGGVYARIWQYDILMVWTCEGSHVMMRAFNLTVTCLGLQMAHTGEAFRQASGLSDE